MLPGEQVFTEIDREAIEAHGLSIREAEEQVRRLRAPRRHTPILRPCTLGDGLRALADEEHPELLRRHREAAAAGRCAKFVPASGAASRMFADLLHYRHAASDLDRLEEDRAAGLSRAVALGTFLDRLEEFPFRADLGGELRRRGGDSLDGTAGVRALLDALLGADGLDYGSMPKGLLPFHDYGEERRTAFEEHLVEAADLARDARSICRVHCTVSPEHEPLFRKLLDGAGAGIGRRLDATFEVSFSAQSPSTDTLALDLEGNLFRTSDGRPLFRASGHGALLRNLAAMDGDLVLIKNVDNVAPDRLKKPTFLWSRLLVGLLVRLQEDTFELCRRLEDGDGAAAEEGLALAASLHRVGAAPDGPPAAEQVLEMLHRPLRVCGMVPNDGEPGGGPFWVGPEPGRASLQIVESAEIDSGSPSQAERFAAGTHFNPVFLACGLRDHRGRPFDLERYVDHDAYLVSRKSADGRELLALERPGLWNGSMAHWNTVFVEVPGIVFNPVKTVLDLLRPEHQAAGRSG